MELTNRAENNEWSVIFAGDWAPSADHVTIIEQNPEAVYGDLLPILRDADISVVNLECVLGAGNERIVKDGPHLSAPSNAVQALKAVPFDLICLANNHAMDHGQSGLESTLSVLKFNNLKWLGAGLNLDEAYQPHVTQVGDIKIALINVAEGEEGKATHQKPGVALLDIPTVEKMIVDLKRLNDLVFVIAHAGREYIPFPPPYVQTTYKRFVEAGADAVIAHHPHVAQGVEMYQGKPIAYSLGNFLFPVDAGEVYWTSFGYLISLHFTGTQFKEFRMIPYRLTSRGLCLLDREESASYLRHLQQFSAFSNSEYENHLLWKAFADDWLEENLPGDLLTISSHMLSVPALIRGLQFRLAQHPTLKNKILRRLLGLLPHWIDEIPAKPNAAILQRGAAMFRNRFDTPAHRELYLTALGQMMSSEPSDTTQAARNALRAWKETKSL